jgi:hypothetical protein
MTSPLARILTTLRRTGGAPADRAPRRAGVEPLPAVIVSPRVWIALG